MSCYSNQLTGLDVSHNTALTTLSCSNNQLSSLDVSHNTALTSLDCSDNQLSSLDVSGATALTTLWCYGNQLTNLDVSHNTALTDLQCFSNQLTSLDVSHNTALTELSCSGNQLSSLDVSGATALTWLDCDGNQLSSLDVSHNTALTSLYCSNNQLPSLDVSHNTALTELSCLYNQLTSLDVSHNTALWFLLCHHNQLSSLDVSHNTALTWLNCPNNQLMSLDLSKCTKLQLGSEYYGTTVSSQSKSVVASSLGSNQYSIDVPADFNLSKVSSFTVNSVSVTPTLSNGKLQFTSSTVPTSVTYQYNTDNSVAGNMKVTVTITSGEGASEVVLNADNFPDDTFRAYISSITGVAEGGTLSEEKLKSVTSINVSGTYSANGGITSLKGVEHFTALTQLSCAYNRLTSLDVSHNTALKRLYCGENQLSSLDLSKCTKLTSTSVSSQSKSVVATSLGSNQYSIDVPVDFNLSKVSSFTVNSVSVTPTLSEGKLLFTSSPVPTSVSYEYNTDNSASRYMYVTVTITSVEDESEGVVVLDATNFPDAKFRAYISDITGVAEGGTLSEEKLKSVTSINVSGTSSANGGITRLKGVEHFTALTTLKCAYNKLSSLDVSHNTALTELWCNGNQLSSLDVSGATALEYLSCYNNQLPSLDVSHNTALEYLSCSYNQLPSLDVSHNTALTFLNCSYNQLTSLDVSHNTALTNLACGYNQLPSLDVSHNTALTYLNCSNNQLSSLDVPHNTALRDLFCYSNQLPSLDVSHNTALTQLSCHSNQLSSLDVSHNTALIYLYCYSNQLPSLDVSHNTALTTLKCYNNQLMSLDLSKCTKLQLGSEYYSTSVSSQSKSVVASSLGSNEYSIDVPADFNLSKVSSFTVNSVSVIPTLSNGKLQFTSSTVPTSVTYQYNTDNSVVGNMEVTVTITDVEDAVPANTVYMDDMEVMTGMEETLSVKMKNEVPMEGFEFDLYVPEGVTVATDGDGFPEVYLSTERTTARKTNSFDAIFLPDGGVRVLAASTNGSAISGNDGEIVTVKVNIGADMAEGDYTVLLKNIALSGTDAVSHPTEQMSSTLHVTYGILGDANRDKRVDVADFTTTAHHILGKNPDPFNDKAANANRDERIDVGDLTAIAHIILYGSVDKPTNGANGLPRRAPATDSGEQGGEGYPTNYVYIDPVSAESGTEQTLSVKMKNAVDAEGFEFDLYLPEGMSFVLDADGFPEATLSTERTTTRKTNSFDAVIQPDGALRVLAASTNGSVISGHDGEVALVKVRIDGDVPTGTYLLTLKEIAVSDVDCVSHRTDELVSDITVESGSPTSLGGVVTDGDDDTYYNMSGQRINKPTRSGVYIQRGKKVVVK